MKKTILVKTSACLLLFILSVSGVFGQNAKPIIFAVINDGKQVEPIAYIEKGKLVPALDGGDELNVKTRFAKTYYKPKTSYNLIFGGASGGTVTITKSNPKDECQSNMAEVSTKPTKAKLGGFVMGLATNAPVKSANNSRRQPTADERAEIVAIVRAEFGKNKVAAIATKNLKFHNMTALDVDADGKAEIVGSSYIEISSTSRNVLFFIAEQNRNGKYTLGFSEYKAIAEDEMMGGSDIKAIDSGIYCELLLDVLEYNGDKTGEIFTYTQGLEGSSFTTYRRAGNGKWVRDFEGSNYHCGF